MFVVKTYNKVNIHLYFEYRVVNATWETTFVSPAAFWDEVPEWKWKEVFNDKSG